MSTTFPAAIELRNLRALHSMALAAGHVIEVNADDTAAAEAETTRLSSRPGNDWTEGQVTSSVTRRSQALATRRWAAANVSVAESLMPAVIASFAEKAAEKAPRKAKAKVKAAAAAGEDFGTPAVPAAAAAAPAAPVRMGVDMARIAAVAAKLTARGMSEVDIIDILEVSFG